MWQFQEIFRRIARAGKDENFLLLVKKVENIVSKVLSIAMLLVIIVATYDLSALLLRELFSSSSSFYATTLIKILGLFLNVLIALELLENITAYLRKHGVQVELVIATSLIAVARKIIIFDFTKGSGVELIGLAVAILSLSISYWIVRRNTD